ncbi:MAG: MBL fold metallo-hydrolase [Chitinophagaceae bacterium]|nr:MBL fold metallo-hydrolase [Chitinophagaceae bacterium]
MKIIPLSEGTFTIDQTKLFVPFDETKEDLQSRSRGSLLVEIQPFIVVTSKDVLLLDTGLGFSKEGVMQIHQNIKEAGIDPESITKVLMTHLHKDHAGGVSQDRDHSQLSFPSATYYVQRRELKFALEKGVPSFIPDEIKILEQSTNVVWLDDDEGKIDDTISYHLTGAHSPFHQVFWIREEGKIVFFGGDDAPQLHQMKHRFAAKYDFNGKKAMELRSEWWEQGSKEHWTFLFYHDIKAPILEA